VDHACAKVAAINHNKFMLLGDCAVFEIIQSGGWMMIPIIICSVLAAAISGERFWTLRTSQIAPANLLGQVWGWMKSNQLDSARIKELRANSPLGRVLAAGLMNSKHGRDIMKESIQEVASHEIHDMERYLNALGTIAAVAPLMGLLGRRLGGWYLRSSCNHGGRFIDRDSCIDLSPYAATTR
jgi:biopolymer transport protein ExbB